jgi:endonuclease YncB( thermonuclease family)
VRWCGAAWRSRGILSAALSLGPSYDAEQLEAEQTQRGLWAGAFVPPWEWRAQR